VTRVRVGVIGLGLIGGSIAKRLAELPDEYEALGHTRSEAASAEAAKAGIEMAGSVEELAAGAELVVVAAPPKDTASLVAAVLAADGDVLVTDVASVKGRIAEAVGDNPRYLPSHPLAGAETSGWPAARADLLDGTTWAVCPQNTGAPAEALCRWAQLFDAFDARLIVCSPGEHDAAVARTSHAPHVVAAAVAATLGRDRSPRLAAALSGGAFRDITRVAGSDPALWREILDLNSKQVKAAIDELRDALDRPPAWAEGREMSQLVDELRWRQPEWTRREFAWPAWDELIALGREGTAIRRPALEDGRLTAEVAAP
jgi:prephenate dehydrogenase